MIVRCLLLVEDEAEELAAVRENLAGSDLDLGEVLVATSLAQAIATIVSRDGEVDVVLLDLDLGDSRSLDTLTAVRAVTDAVVIALSSCEDELLCVRSLQSGADDFLVKSSMTPRCLRKVILKSMTRRQIRQCGARIDKKLRQLEMAGG